MKKDVNIRNHIIFDYVTYGTFVYNFLQSERYTELCLEHNNDRITIKSFMFDEEDNERAIGIYFNDSKVMTIHFREKLEDYPVILKYYMFYSENDPAIQFETKQFSRFDISTSDYMFSNYRYEILCFSILMRKITVYVTEYLNFPKLYETQQKYLPLHHIGDDNKILTPVYNMIYNAEVKSINENNETAKLFRVK